MNHTESEWGRYLMTLRGFQYVMASLHDSYAMALTTDSTAGRSPINEIRAASEQGISSLGTLVISDPDVVATALNEAPLGTAHATTTVGPEISADHVNNELWETWQTCHVLPLGPAPTTTPDQYTRLHQHTGLLNDATAALTTRLQHHLETLLRETPARSDAISTCITPATAAFVEALTGVDKKTIATLLTHSVNPFDALLCPPRAAEAQDLIRFEHQLSQDVSTALAAIDPTPLVAALRQAHADQDDQGDLVTLICLYGATTLRHVITESVRGHVSSPNKTPIELVDHTLRTAPPSLLKSRITQHACNIGGHDLEADHHVVLCTATDSNTLHAPLFLTGKTYEPLLAALIPAAIAAVGTLTTHVTPVEADETRVDSRTPLSLTRLQLTVEQKNV